METTLMGYIGAIWGYYIGVNIWDNGKEHGNYYNGCRYIRTPGLRPMVQL